MAKLRIPVSLLWVMLIVIVILAALLGFLHFNRPNVQTTSSLPSSIQYSLEYFNAANQNKTLLVPSQYYKAAEDYSINDNKVVENNSLYSLVLFGGVTLPQNYDVLIDISNASYFSDLIFFPINFTLINLSLSLKDCYVASNKTRGFAICEIYSNITLPVLNGTSRNETVKIGEGTFVNFPNSTSSEINNTIIYDGLNRESVSSLKINGTQFYNGVMFVYDNITAFYLSEKDMETFYGREMFLPNSTLKNVVANFGSVRIIS